MELEAGNSTAGAATAASHATHQHAVANNDATANQRPSAAGVAYPAVVASLDNELRFTLTVGQALEWFAAAHRNASPRSFATASKTPAVTKQPRSFVFGT